MEQFLGTGVGLSATTITRLTTQWQDEARSFGERSLAEVDFVYLWVDGIHLNVRLEQERLCLLVMIGVRAGGRKELVALTDGVPGSPPSRGRICCSGCVQHSVRYAIPSPATRSAGKVLKWKAAAS